jgi:hypothetical protein
MDRRLFHIGAGDIPGLVWDVLTTDLDGLALGSVLLATINGNQSNTYGALFSEQDTQFQFFPMFLHCYVRTAMLIVGVPTLSVGTNSPSYNDIIGATTLTGLSLAGRQSVYLPVAGGRTAAYGSDVYVNVTTAGIGTSLTLSASLIGVLA